MDLLHGVGRVNLGRIFASAIVRRLAYVLVALLLAALGVGKAHAADQGQAYALAEADRAAYASNLCRSSYAWTVNGPTRVVHDAVAKSYHAEIDCVYSDGGALYLTRASQAHAYDTLCTSRAPAVNLGFTFRPGTTQCVNGCATAWAPNEGEGNPGSTGVATGGACSKSTWTCPSGSEGSAVIPGPSDSEACEPPLPDCQEGQERVDGVCKAKETCPAGQHTNQKGECEKDSDNCPAGQTKGPDGSCVDNSCPTSIFTGSNGTTVINQVKGKDGTCKADADNDGKADDEQDDDDPNKDGKKFSGGDSCDAPPTCSGDAIACGQARIQWRIDCNTRADAKISGGSCAAMPVCTGKNCKAVEYSSLVMQWRATCALEREKDGTQGNNADVIANDKAMKQAEVDGLRALGQNDGMVGEDGSGIWAKDGDVSGELSETMLGGSGGTCDLSFSIGGSTITPPPQFWTIVSMIHWLLVAAGYFWVAQKLGV